MTAATQIVGNVGARTAAPLLAVCGVCGGAGTTTLATLIAHAAARGGDVLLAGPSDLSALTGARTPWNLSEACGLLARDPLLACGLWDVALRHPYELRVIAADAAAEDQPRHLEASLESFRDEHSLVVVDCGTLQRDVDRRALSLASHVAWVLPDTPRGAHRAAEFLASTPRRLGLRELVLARRDITDEAASLSDLAALATTRSAPLVHAPAVVGDLVTAVRQAEVALQAVVGALQR
ncbi:MAG TPA: hypothetical protein VNS09_01470 [Solirubrobacter sp.]|nr:hypothetical protein [Solirubrobacter sp.]